jgi:hypothetical protein
MADFPRLRPPFPGYETSAYELDPAITCDPAPWMPADLAQTMRDRTSRELSRREILINYYRIGHPLAFALPVKRRPTVAELPIGIASLTYPWLIWLVWALEERWRILHASWRQQGDAHAGCTLQQELAALSGWDHFHEMSNEVGLVTGHIAGVLALALADESGWDPVCLSTVRTTADALLDRDIAPWFPAQWPEGQPLTPQRLHNIPVIALMRAAQLARVRQHPLMAALDQQAIAVLQVWAGYRTGQHHTEGTSYDGYLMDSLTGWLAELPQRSALLAATAAAFRSQADQWIGLTLPGRLDLHAPLGDTEAEMPYWINALQRLTRWYEWPDARWLIKRIPLTRLPAAAVAEIAPAGDPAPSTPLPHSALLEQANAVTFRSGWARRDFSVALSLPRNPLHHLHHDGGHLIFGWQGRFWITDPGYQQYRPGEERDYTIGLAAHNAPVINNTAQNTNAGRLVRLDATATLPHAQIDLSRCYPDLATTAVVQRECWTTSSGTPLVVLRDRFENLGNGAKLAYHWLGGAQLAWAFVSGWARLSDGEHALWLGAADSSLAPAGLGRHLGSRGPLTLTHNLTLPDGSGERWWVLWGDAAGGWIPPTVIAGPDNLKVILPTAAEQVHTFEA